MSKFGNRDVDMMVKCEGVTNSYTKYIHFIHSLDARDGNRTW